MNKIFILVIILLITISTVFANQFARPDKDLNVNSWQNSPLFSKINETSPIDTNFIGSPLSGGSTNISLSSVTDPSSSTAHKISIRAKKFPIGVSGQTVTLNVILYQGSTQIASFSNVLAGIFTTYTYNLTATEADAITDYSNLTAAFVATTDVTEPLKRANVSWFQLEVPDAPAAINSHVIYNKENGELMLRGDNMMIFRGG